MPTIFFERQAKTVRVNAGWNLRKLAKQNGVQVYNGLDKAFNCRGNGLCGTCKIEVFSTEPGAVNPRTAMEEKKLTGYTNPKLRLSCQVKVHGNIKVKTYPVELMKQNKEVVAPPVVS